MEVNLKPLILIVEDDKHLSMINCQALESEGYAVKTAFSLREALFLLDDGDPDIILLDIMMPEPANSSPYFCFHHIPDLH